MLKLEANVFFLTIEAPIPQNGQTLKQFVGNLPMNCLSVFNHFVKLTLKGLISKRKKNKRRSVKALVRKLEVNLKEICDQAKIDEIKIFFEEVFKCHKGKSFTNLSYILNSLDVPCLTNEQTDFWDIELGEKEIYA